jgi:omega-6 fatty acid desaturase (delta-12 desaturase)
MVTAAPAPDGTGGRGAAPPLRAVQRTIPAACHVRSTCRGLAAAARDLALLALVTTVLVRSDAWWVLIPAWAVAASTISGLFVLGHDAAHGALFDQPWLNGLVGRIVMLPSLHALSVWAYGHNRIHHAFTVCQGLDFVWHPVTPAQFRRLPRVARWLHRVEWSAAGSGVYYLRAMWWGKIVRGRPPARLRAAFRRDRLLVAAVLLLGLAALAGRGARAGGTAGAAWMCLKVWGVPWLLWNAAIGWAVYIHHIAPTVRWYPRRTWTKFRGQVEGGTVFRLPPWLNVFWHNIFVHVPHHVDPRIPYYHLPRAAAALQAAFGDAIAERPYRLRDYVRTTRRCKLYDFARGEWRGYDAAVED